MGVYDALSLFAQYSFRAATRSLYASCSALVIVFHSTLPQPLRKVAASGVESAFGWNVSTDDWPDN